LQDETAIPIKGKFSVINSPHAVEVEDVSIAGQQQVRLGASVEEVLNGL
jgi:hypothetical protein